MKQYHISSHNESSNSVPELVQKIEAKLEYQREVLNYITEIGSSLRLHMDTDTLLKRVSEAACKALRFRYSALYLSNGKGHFVACATAGVGAEEEEYLRQHPVPDAIVAQLINEQYRLSDSYFIPAEAELWNEKDIAEFFVVDEMVENPAPPDQRLPPEYYWQARDLLLVPLVSGDNNLLGFLTPDAPLDCLRPTFETMTLLELFVNQAAVVIEGTRLYEEAQRSSEERAALIEIGRALSAPDALRDLQTVYQTIYEQVRRMMPADAFFVTRYYPATNKLIMDYLIDEGVVYPAEEYPYTPARTRNFLADMTRVRVFSTAEEYAKYRSDDVLDSNDGLIGQDRPSESLLFVPIHYSEEVLGFLSAQSYQPHAYNQRHIEMLKEIGVQAGIAIANARMYTDLREALQYAQESERLKNHFLMTASHELRTPLTAIQGYLELLGSFNSVLDEESKLRFINNARRACEELVLLLGNVMDTSRIDQDRVSLNLSSVQVIRAVQMIMEILEPTITREERKVEISIDEDLYVWVDDLRLRQILLNVVGNALKYTPAPSGIAISAERLNYHQVSARIAATNCQIAHPLSEEFVVIRIRDWGPGISLEDQSRLFTKFMRLESAMNSIQRGAGLGLYLCRQLTEAMRGQIWLESSGIEGEGSTFLIALPVSEM